MKNKKQILELSLLWGTVLIERFVVQIPIEGFSVALFAGVLGATIGHFIRSRRKATIERN